MRRRPGFSRRFTTLALIPAATVTSIGAAPASAASRATVLQTKPVSDLAMSPSRPDANW